jgi:hypothetical protein
MRIGIAALAVVCSAVSGAPGAEEKGAPLKILMAVVPEAESMAKFRDFLKENYRVEIAYVDGAKSLDGIEALATSDVFVSNLRRTSMTDLDPKATVLRHSVVAGKTHPQMWTLVTTARGSFTRGTTRTT